MSENFANGSDPGTYEGESPKYNAKPIKCKINGVKNTI